MSPHYYTTGATEQFISMMIEEHGYHAVRLSEGTNGIGDWILFAPDGEYTNYIIKEVAINEQSSAQTIERKIRIPKKYLKLMEERKNG